MRNVKGQNLGIKRAIKRWYVAGALLTLYDAIELYPSGDREDQAFQGLKIRRSNTGNVEEMIVKKGAAGEKTEYVRERQESGEGDLWKAEIIERPDTEILFYSLDDLSLTFEERIGGERILFGWDRDHKKTAVGQLMADREKHEKTDREYSIYGFSGGRPLFEFTGGDLTKLSYDGRNKLLKGDFAGLRRKGKEWKLSEGTLVYHLDRDGNRDALTDPLYRRLDVLPCSRDVALHRCTSVLAVHERILDSLLRGNVAAAASILRYEYWVPESFGAVFAGHAGDVRPAPQLPEPTAA